MNDTEIWLERLNSLYKSQMRQAVSKVGIQLVHMEILQYLSICNRYSNTAQALSEYLGQTKGSISQSLKIMENMGHIKREPSIKDKRSMTLSLTKKGEDCLEKVAQSTELNCEESEEVIAAIRSLLGNWQSGDRRKGFGQCQSCRYNKNPSKNEFICGLTDDSLSVFDIKKICREHEFISV